MWSRSLTKNLSLNPIYVHLSPLSVSNKHYRHQKSKYKITGKEGTTDWNNNLKQGLRSMFFESIIQHSMHTKIVYCIYTGFHDTCTVPLTFQSQKPSLRWMKIFSWNTKNIIRKLNKEAKLLK